MSSSSQQPLHVGYVVDGNRRWARQHNKTAYEGHLAGYEAIKQVAISTFQAGASHVSAYVFSTENWKRTPDEVKKLMRLVLRLVSTDLALFDEHNIQLKVLGTRQWLSSSMVQAIDKAEAHTANNTGGSLVLCFNYGGRLEIVDAVKKVVQSGVSPEDITEDLITENLYSPEVPPVDLLVRTSGEKRLSNFMLWRSAYSELMFIDKNWPDMTNQDVTAILEEYSRRTRRFGG